MLILSEEDYLFMKTVRSLIPRGSQLPENLRVQLFTLERRLVKTNPGGYIYDVAQGFNPNYRYNQLIKDYEDYHASQTNDN